MSNETPPPGPTAKRPEKSTSLARLWLRYKKARGARIGLYLVLGFTLTAFLAPFLAHRLPFYWRDSVTGDVSWPLLREFFAPADTTEPALERGMNFLFLFLPVAAVAWKTMNRFFPALGKMESRVISMLFGALAASALWLALGGMVIDAGGRDWLYRETPPVPEIDDIADVDALKKGGGDASAIAERLRQSGWTDFKGDRESRRRVLISHLQLLIEGHRLPDPGDGFAYPDFPNSSTRQAIATARFNRLVLEHSFPGLLVPMRQFRSAFLAAAFTALVVLSGLSYIFLAGAWQFALSPRWLVLFAVAALMALPFRLTARHDQKPYRQLAETGKGWGIFPLIPYGPNENVFGPRLPPTWHVRSPLLDAAAIRSWDRLAALLDDPANEPAHQVRLLLDKEQPDWPTLIENPDGQKKIIATLNALIASDEFRHVALAPSLTRDANIGPYAAALKNGADSSPANTLRLNRLLLEKSLPGVLLPPPANHWKKPRDADGYHFLGTDESGRDVLVRVIHGARVSLSVGFVSVFLATAIGLVLGSLAGYYGGRIDMLISRFLEVMMCFPSFFLILAVIAVLDRRSIVNIMLVIGLTSWTGVARLIRGEMLRQRKMDYVAASIVLGASDTRTIFRHILPNAMAPVLVSISFGITGAILTEAGLSFIGFGVTPPTPTWGQLLSETRESPLANWWLAVFPGIILFLSVLAYNTVGEGVREALDPRSAL